MRSRLPLTLGELVAYIDGANGIENGGLVFGTLEAWIESSGDAEGLRNSVWVSSGHPAAVFAISAGDRWLDRGPRVEATDSFIRMGRRTIFPAHGLADIDAGLVREPEQLVPCVCSVGNGLATEAGLLSSWLGIKRLPGSLPCGELGGHAGANRYTVSADRRQAAAFPGSRSF